MSATLNADTVPGRLADALDDLVRIYRNAIDNVDTGEVLEEAKRIADIWDDMAWSAQVSW